MTKSKGIVFFANGGLLKQSYCLVGCTTDKVGEKHEEVKQYYGKSCSLKYVIVDDPEGVLKKFLKKFKAKDFVQKGADLSLLGPCNANTVRTSLREASKQTVHTEKGEQDKKKAKAKAKSKSKSKKKPAKKNTKKKDESEDEESENEETEEEGSEEEGSEEEGSEDEESGDEESEDEESEEEESEDEDEKKSSKKKKKTVKGKGGKSKSKGKKKK